MKIVQRIELTDEDILALGKVADILEEVSKMPDVCNLDIYEGIKPIKKVLKFAGDILDEI